MHRWYVKAQGQSLAIAEARASALGCEAVLENTSTQVTDRSGLAHVIIQTRKGVNTTLLEPTTRAVLDTFKDEPPTLEEQLAANREAQRVAARLRLQNLVMGTLQTSDMVVVVKDILIALGLHD